MICDSLLCADQSVVGFLLFEWALSHAQKIRSNFVVDISPVQSIILKHNHTTMKTLRTLAALAFVALSIAACKTENPEEPIVPEEPTTRTLQVEVTPEVTTRASIDDNTTFAWDDADSRLFSVLVDGKFVEADSFAIDGNKATFNVEIPTTALSLQAFYRPVGEAISLPFLV